MEHRLGDPVYAENSKQEYRKLRTKREVVSIGFEYRHGLINVSNTLVVRGKLARTDYHRKFRCVSWNTEQAPPVEREVTLDMTCTLT